MSSHGQFVALATRLINREGRQISFISQKGTWDNKEESEPLVTKGVQVKAKRRDEDESVLLAFLVDASFEVNKKMKLVDRQKEYSILNVELIKPGDQSILYRVTCSV